MPKFVSMKNKECYSQVALTEEGDVYVFWFENVDKPNQVLKSKWYGNIAEQRKQQEALDTDKKAALEKLTQYERTILGLPRTIGN